MLFGLILPVCAICGVKKVYNELHYVPQITYEYPPPCPAVKNGSVESD